MKKGDLVKLKSVAGRRKRAGLIVELIEKKCWRTQDRGTPVDWNKIDPEPHAVVMFNGVNISFPVVDLEVVSEAV
jgi:hypothetical protein|tara:strand:- start:87 stop:311 length:225 start_codon:yes stop_codon:yes gene_type:complete